jgi:hypothetical protein
VTGSSTFRIKLSDKFQRTFQELLKRHYKGSRVKQAFKEFLAQVVQDLSNNFSLQGSFAEALPGGLRLSEEWEFRKYYFDMPSLRGASKQGRLMYLVNRSQGFIWLLWMYTHSGYEKRPPDKSLKQLLQELIESSTEDEETLLDNDNCSDDNDKTSEST